ncbi:MAG: hypothetical protein KAR06_03765 [Deltaproteobacteria bacterium]|nr:hypothetical protein [Deltaproteobacteria bacterium]
MTDVTIWDDKSQAAAQVSVNGELIVGAFAYDTPHYVSVDTALTAFEIVPAKAGKRFIVKSMLLATNKDYASPTVAETLTIYEASPADLSTNLKTFTQVDFLRNDRLPISGLNIATSTAVSLVATADSSNIDVTIAGYYVAANGDD